MTTEFALPWRRLTVTLKEFVLYTVALTALPETSPVRTATAAVAPASTHARRPVTETPPAPFADVSWSAGVQLDSPMGLLLVTAAPQCESRYTYLSPPTNALYQQRTTMHAVYCGLLDDMERLAEVESTILP
jgi:hypothetical protein